MKRKLGVDTGKYATKCVMRRSREYHDTDKQIKFLTRMDSNELNFGGLQGEMYSVEFEGKKYRIGEGADYESFSDSKAENIHKICLYTAIALAVDNGDNVSLGIGCPINIFVNKDARESYQRYMMGGKDITIRVEGQIHYFHIDSIFVCPESAGVVYLYYEKYKERIVGVIDIGGLNTNCGVYNHIVPEHKTLFTTRLGGKVMRRELLDELNEKLALAVPIQDYQMDDILKDGYVRNRRDSSVEEFSKKIIKDYKRTHIQNIYESCIQKSWSLDTIDLVFIGGASLYFREEIKEIFGVNDDAFFEDSDMLNAKGFLRAIE